MKKAFAAILGLLVLLTSITAFAAPADDTKTQIQAVKATIRVNNAQIKSIRDANKTLAASIVKTIKDSKMRAIPSLSAQYAEIKELLGQQKAAQKTQRQTAESVRSLLVKARAAVAAQNLASALDLFKQAAAKQTELIGQLNENSGRLQTISGKVNALAPEAQQALVEWTAFKSAAESKRATIKTNHEAISAVNQQIRSTLKGISTKIQQANSTGTPPQALTDLMPELKTGLSQVREQLKALYGGQMKALYAQYREHKKAGDYDKATSDLDAILSLQEKRKADLPGLLETVKALDAKVDAAIGQTAA